MRTIRWILAALLAVVTVLYAMNGISERISGRDEGPVLTCAEEVLEVSVRDEESVLLTGVTAMDKQDGDLTDEIIVGGVSKLIGGDTAKVTCLVFDSDDNMASCVRLIRYTDYRRPIITLNAPLEYATTDAARLLERVEVSDVIDGDLTVSARVSTLWPTEHSQVYSATIQATNSMGDTASVKVPVIIREENPSRPEVRLKSQIVYIDQGSAFDPMDYVTGGRALEIQNDVDTTRTGCYWVWYFNNSGAVQGLAILTVVVE